MIVRSDALIVVDVQNDFCEGGALAVGDAVAIVPIINSLIARFPLVVYTRDWHPADHASFSDAPTFEDQSWPVHCVAHTPSAAFHPALTVLPNMPIMSKGKRIAPESYSAFQDTDIFHVLREKNVERVFICGLATDYCVKQTALDAKRAGFDVCVVQDACRPVDNPPGTGQAAIKSMADAGVSVLDSAAIR